MNEDGPGHGPTGMRAQTGARFGGHQLARDTLWNLLGVSAPLLAALVCMPGLIQALGAERFGMLTLVWALIGYFGILDLGVGRALNQRISVALAEGRSAEIPPLTAAALVALAGFGFLATLALLALAPWITAEVLKTSPSLRRESAQTLRLLALALPMAVATAGLRGVLEAFRRFDWINAIRVPIGVLSFAAPLAATAAGPSLVPVTATLVGVRLLALLAHAVLCLRLVPGLPRAAPAFGSLGRLVGQGGWMTVTTVMGSLLGHADRIVLASALSVTAVGYFATASEMVSKLWLLPAALTATLFPAFAGLFVQDRSRAALLFRRGVKYAFLAAFPCVLVLVVYANEILSLWLGPDFADHTAPVLRWLALGVLFGSAAQVPTVFAQSCGRAELPALIDVVAVVAYLTLLPTLASRSGLEGVAVARFLRVVLSAAATFAVVARAFPGLGRGIAVPLWLLAAAGVPLAIAWLMPPLDLRLAAGAAVLLGLGALTWGRLLGAAERRWLVAFVR